MTDPRSARVGRTTLWLGFCGILMVLPCLWLRDHRSAMDLCLAGGLLSLLYTGMVVGLWRSPSVSRRFMGVALLLGLTMRLALLTGLPPIADDDIWRYRWDGRVVASGVNPYRHAPIDDALDGLADDSRLNIGFPWIKTIYPPAAEWLFASVAAMHPAGILPFRWLALTGDLLALLPLWRLLRSDGRPAGWLLLYLWHPVVLKEVADSGHVDAWVALPLLMALLVRSDWGRGIWLALASGVKVAPLLLIPWWLRTWRATATCVAACLLMGLWALVWPDGLAWNMGGWLAFSGQWEFNSGPFAIVQAMTVASGGPAWLPRLLMAGVFTGVWVMTLRRCKDTVVAAQVIYLAVFALSPVVNPWYFLPLIALTVLRPHPVPLAWSVLVTLSYGHYLPWGDLWYRLLEYGALAVVVWFWHRNGRRVERQASGV